MRKKLTLNSLLFILWLASFLFATPSWSTPQSKGFRFPSFKVTYFQFKPNRRYYRRIFDFAKIIGKEPIILFYFLPDHAPSITELKVFAAASKIFKGKIRFFCVTKAQTRREARKAYRKLKKLKISLPVLLDQKGLLAYVMLTRRVPAYALINRSGYLKLAGAGSLVEKINPSQTVMDLLKLLAQGKDFPFIEALGYTPNPYDLIGKKAPNFKAELELLSTAQPHRSPHYKWTTTHFELAHFIKKNRRPILLIYWSITCPHCRRVVPLVGQLERKYRSVFKMIGILDAPKKYRKLIIEFMKHYGLTFKLLSQKEMNFPLRYRVMKVPSFFLLDKNGIIRAFRIGGSKNVEKDLLELLSHLPAR